MTVTSDTKPNTIEIDWIKTGVARVILLMLM
jgi:hypothetical protein